MLLCTLSMGVRTWTIMSLAPTSQAHMGFGMLLLPLSPRPNVGTAESDFHCEKSGSRASLNCVVLLPIAMAKL